MANYRANSILGRCGCYWDDRTIDNGEAMTNSTPLRGQALPASGQARELAMEKQLVEELNLLPDYASEYFMRVWKALIQSRIALQSVESSTAQECYAKAAQACKKSLNTVIQMDELGEPIEPEGYLDPVAAIRALAGGTSSLRVNREAPPTSPYENAVCSHPAKDDPNHIHTHACVESVGENLQPTYYVRHPDDSYSVANPQPTGREAMERHDL